MKVLEDNFGTSNQEDISNTFVLPEENKKSIKEEIIYETERIMKLAKQSETERVDKNKKRSSKDDL